MRLGTLLAVSVLGALAAGATATATPRTPLVTWTSSACPPGPSAPVPVLVTTSFIRKGTLGSVILKRHLYGVAAIPCSQRVVGAIGEPALLKGLVTNHDIFPGKQLRRSDFSGVLRLALTTPVRAGTYAQLTVRVTPTARCAIDVFDDTASKARELGPKTGGRITWRWKVAASTHPGRWPIVIRCGKSGNLRLTIRVLR